MWWAVRYFVPSSVQPAELKCEEQSIIDILKRDLPRKEDSQDYYDVTLLWCFPSTNHILLEMDFEQQILMYDPSIKWLLVHFSHHVARDYVDRLSMDYILQLKKATVAGIHNLQGYLHIPQAVLRYSEYIHVTKWSSQLRWCFSISINSLWLMLQSKTCWYWAKSRLGTWCLTNPTEAYLTRTLFS